VPHSAIKKDIQEGGLQEWAQIRHFVPHPWQSKSEGMDCEMSSANRWIANSALCASSGNQEMAKQLCEGVPAPEQYHVTGTVRRSIDSLNFA
jgi:hypothetical protein